jgi:hypothetical protein
MTLKAIKTTDWMVASNSETEVWLELNSDLAIVQRYVLGINSRTTVYCLLWHCDERIILVIYIPMLELSVFKYCS